ncbi:hypothetical protein J3S90_14845 [Flavobacterium sp. P4023]|uniref:DUF2892 domain-containing protein n=1 Tax=Flavobacterium flabelliforme TaxID=2816119 RepID=A0ABS5CWU9_9FLAO|nr:hypothetical protein [Flavobacterium flabelliforme]
MKNLLFTNWHLMRFVRLAIVLFLFSQAYLMKDWIFVGIGLFFLIQVIFNLGCGPNGCAIPNNKYSKR